MLCVTSLCMAESEIDLKPPGQIFDIGGLRLHLNCQGTGSPVIVFDSGAGGFSLEWLGIQEALSKQTRTCSYDRAGYGWSAMGPLPRTSRRITGELRELLNTADISPPYILVGHSFGGFTAQYFARHYPEDVAALMLIDSSHPEQSERFPRANKNSERSFPTNSRTYNVSRPIVYEHYPSSQKRKAYRLMSYWTYAYTLREEMANLPLSAEEVRLSSPLPTIPMVVLTRGKRVWPNNGHGDEMEKIWMELQDELSTLGRDTVHLIAENSGHSIHLDQPGLVISALKNLLEEQKN